MEWSTDTTKCEHDKDYLVYYDGFFKIHDIQVYKKHEDGDTKFTGEGFYSMDSNYDYWKKCFNQPTHFRELDYPVV